MSSETGEPHVALDLSGTAVVRAQAAGGASPAGSDKSGVVDVRQAIVSTAEGKQASEELQSQFAARKNDLEARSKQIATQRDRLASAQMLSEDERASLQRQGQHLTTQYDHKSTDLNEDLQAEQNDVVERIGRKIDGRAAALFQRKRLCGVVRFFGANSPILYHASHIDLTQEIVRLYDQAYPAKGGTPATKPAAAGQKPAPTVSGVKPQ
jgi:outer membrane protein